MDIEMIIPEDGTPQTSWSNIYNLMQIHGSIVAISHAILACNIQVTKIFFFDGQSHISDGFAMDSLKKGAKELCEERETKIHGLFMSAQSIPGMISLNPDSLLDIGTDARRDLKNGFDLVFNFYPSEDMILQQTKESDGMEAFEQSVEFLKENEKCNIYHVC